MIIWVWVAGKQKCILFLQGADVTMIATDSWHQIWPIQEANIQHLGNRTLSYVKQSTRWVKCIGLEGQKGNLKLHEANITMILWGHDLLEQWILRLTFLQP